MRTGSLDALRRAKAVIAVCMELLFGLAICHGPASAMAGVAPSVIGGHWHILDFALSPDGRKLAELVHVRRRDVSSMEVVVRDLNDAELPAHTVFKGLKLSSVKWLNDREIAFVTSGRKTKIFMDNVISGHMTVLLKTHKKISGLLPERQGDLLAYSYVSDKVFGKSRNAVSVKVKDDFAVLNLALPKKRRAIYDMKFHVGIIRWNAKGGKLLGEWQLRWTAFVPRLIWVNGRLMALSHGVTADRSFLVDVRTGKIFNEGMPGRWIYLLGVRHGRVAAASTMSHVLEEGGQPLRIFVRDRAGSVRALTAVDPVMVRKIWFGAEHQVFAQGRFAGPAPGSTWLGLVDIDWKRNKVMRVYRWPDGILGNWMHICGVDWAGDRAVCVAQTLRSPPTLVLVDLKSGAMSRLGYLRSDARRLDFSFRKLVIRNAFGEKSSGFLALPNDWRRHTIPLAVMAYGFHREYSRYGQWITSYPVAKLVHAGIAVLLLNFPDELPWPKGDFRAAYREEIAGPLSTVASAVPAVRQAGVKVTRAMIMGWSHGGLIAAFAIQDLHQFVAAQVGDPEEWTITAYALGGVSWRRFLDRQFGGPPDRRYINRYLDFDPVSDGRPAHGPILFEFVSANVPEGQFLEEWRAAGTEVEAFAYKNSIHYLNIPTEAKISRERNFDWAKLNLLGPQSVSPAELRRVGLSVPIKGRWSRAGRRQAGR